MAIIDRVAAAMRDQPWGVTEEQGRLLYSFILREEPEQILELGCGIGTSACYMAAALAELGRGRVTSIDRNPDLLNGLLAPSQRFLPNSKGITNLLFRRPLITIICSRSSRRRPRTASVNRSSTFVSSMARTPGRLTVAPSSFPRNFSSRASGCYSMT